MCDACGIAVVAWDYGGFLCDRCEEDMERWWSRRLLIKVSGQRVLRPKTTDPSGIYEAMGLF